MFHAHSQPRAAGRRTVEMVENPVSGASSRRERPGPLLLGKDQPLDIFKALAPLDDERVLVAGGGSLITSFRQVQVRRWPDLKVESTLPAGGDDFDVRAPEVLAAGPLWRGEQQSALRMDLGSGQVLGEYPVRPPFLLTDGGFIGWMRQRFDFETDSVVDPALLPPWPELAARLDTRRPLLLSCTWEGRVRWALDLATFAPEWTRVAAMARTPEGHTFFVATERSLAEVEFATGRVRWSQSWNDAPGAPLVSHAAVACDATRVAVVGESHGQVARLRVLDRSRQRVLFAAEASDRSALESVAFTARAGTLLVGTRSGLLLLFDEAFTRREVRLARVPIRDVCEARGGVLAACHQRELRFLPLLDDEA